MKRRLIPHWPTLWTHLGVRPGDAPNMTFDEAWAALDYVERARGGD